MPFYHYEEEYNGSVITISVERDTDSFDSSVGPVPLHTILGMIDSVDLVTEDAPLHPVDGRPGLQDRIPAIIQSLKNEIDSKDDFAVIMEGLSFVSGSEPIENYTATLTGTGEITHSWTNDPDIDIESLDQDTDPDFGAPTLIHNGALSPPIVDTGYPSGHYYFKIRGQRTGEDPGPWSYADVIVP